MPKHTDLMTDVHFRDADGSLRRNLAYIAREMAREFGGQQTLADAARYAAQHMAETYRRIESERKADGARL